MGCTDSNAGCGCRYLDGNAYKHTNRHTDWDSKAYKHTNPDTDRDSNAYKHTNRDTDRDSDTYPYTESYKYASSD